MEILKKIIAVVLVNCSLAAGSIDENVFVAPIHTMENLGLSLVKPGERVEDLSDGDRELSPIAVNALLAIYQGMNRNVGNRDCCLPRSEYRIPGNLWQSLHPNEDHLIPVFDCSLTNALDEVRNASSPCVIDCTIAGGIARYALLESLIPEIKDNVIKRFFINKKQQQILKEQNCVVSETRVAEGFLMAMFHHSGVVEGVENIKPGDFVYIKGHPDYIKKHPLGMSRGENLFLVGYNAAGLKMYIGYGDFFKDGPKIAKDIQEYLTQQYLLGQNPENFKEAYEKIRKMRPLSLRLDIEQIQERRRRRV